MEQNKPQTSGLSSKLKAKSTNTTQPSMDQIDPNQKKYIFYLDVTIQDKIDLPKVQLSVPLTMKVSEAIDMALTKFKFELETLGISVNNNQKLYNARLTKKNGRAKTDMPSLDGDQILSQIKISSVSLQIKDPSAVVLASVVIEKPTPPPLKQPQPELINQQIGVSKKQPKQIGEVSQQPTKPDSGCFFSFC